MKECFKLTEATRNDIKEANESCWTLAELTEHSQM